MTDEKKNTPRSQSDTMSFPDPTQIFEKAKQKVIATSFPDLDTMTREEIQLRFHELHVKQLAADLQIEQLRSQLEKRDEQAVLFRIVTENMLDMVALTDMEGNFLFAGKSHEVLGYEPGFLIGKNVMDFVHPQDLLHILEEFAEFVAMDHPRRVEYRYRCKDGSYLWLETWGNFTTDENGIPEKIVFSSRDITERKQAEEKVSDLNQFFSSTIDGLSYHIAVLNQQGIVILVNRAWREFAQANGVSAQQVSEGADYLDVCSHANDENSEEAGAFAEAIRAVISGVSDSYSLEYPCHSPDKKRWFTGRVTPFLEDAPRRVVVGHEDITDRKQAEEALKESERFLQILVESLPLPVFYKDVEGRYKGFNKAFETFFGRAKSELIGCSVFDIHPTELAEIYHAKDLELFDKISIQIYESQVKNAYGQLRDVVFQKATLTNTSGVITGLVGTIMDITERKQAEQKLAERTELAETQSRQLQELTVELIEAEERERRRIADLLHDDLQQLLAAARMQVEVLITKYPSEKIPKTVKQLLNDSIENTRHLSYELSPPVLHHSGLVAAIKWLVHRMHEQFELQVDLEIKKTAHIEVNHPLKVFLFRAVQELLFNIVKHCDVNKAWVTLSEFDNSLVITVSDQGKGFNPEILSGFDKSGLGLASIKTRARSAGGGLHIESVPGGGSQMTLTVPLSPAGDFQTGKEQR